MSTYGKYMPYRRYHATLQRRNALSGPTAFSESNYGLQLEEIRNNKPDQGTTDQQVSSKEKSKQMLRNSSFRLIDSIVPQIGEPHKIIRCSWVLIYLGLFATFTFTFYELVDKYTKFPTTMDFTIETNRSLDFPSLTVCDQNSSPRVSFDFDKKLSDIFILDEYVEKTIHYRSTRNIKDCPKDFFVCEDRLNCFPMAWVCDGNVHCEDESDEDFTTEACYKETMARIWTDAPFACIPPYIECMSYGDLICTKTCDSIFECPNAEDEINESFTCSTEGEYLAAATVPIYLDSGLAESGKNY